MTKKGGYWIIEDSQSFCACQMNVSISDWRCKGTHSQMEPELGTVFCFLIYPHKKIPPQIDVRKGECPKLLKFPRGCQMNAQEVHPVSQVGWLGGLLPIQHSTIPWDLCQPGTLQCHTLKLYLKWKQGLKTAAPVLNLLGGSSMRHGGEGCKVCSIFESGYRWGKRVRGH